MIKWMTRSDEIPLEDWQRDLLADNLSLFYSAMKKHKMDHHAETDIGRDVLAYVTRAMRNYNPSRGKLSTFIYKYVDFGLRDIRRRYRNGKDHSTYVLSSFGSKESDSLDVADPSSVEDKQPYLIEELESSLRYLCPQQHKALMLYYRDGHTCESGGAIMGLSKQRYQQVLNNALHKLKLLMPKPNWHWD